MIDPRLNLENRFTKLVPEGWKKSIFSKKNCMYDSKKTHKLKAIEQEQLWTKITGVSPKNSYLTIIVPIRNGGIYLTPMLYALISADIPRSTHTTFLFITNACTDRGKSKKAIRSLLKTIGAIKKGSVKKEFPILKDPGLNNSYHRVKIDNTKLMHFDTATPGKTNALNLGNAIANLRNSVAFCVDANTFVEPNAIAEIYKEAYEFYDSPQSDIQLIMGRQKHDPLPKPQLPKELRNIPSLSNLSLKELLPVLISENENIPLQGSFMAWSPSYIQSVGGFPNVANEDGALVLKLRANMKKTIIAKNAICWEIRPQTLKDREKTLSRLVRGWLQTIKAYPEYEQDIRKLIPNMKDKETGIIYKDLVKWQKDHPNVPTDALPYIFELSKKSYQKGKKEYEKNPKMISW